jgi:hypothetical protein
VPDKQMKNADGERYLAALEKIRAHMLVVCGNHFYLSTVFKIADEALEPEKDNFPFFKNPE